MEYSRHLLRASYEHAVTGDLNPERGFEKAFKNAKSSLFVVYTNFLFVSLFVCFTSDHQTFAVYLRLHALSFAVSIMTNSEPLLRAPYEVILPHPTSKTLLEHLSSPGDRTLDLSVVSPLP